MKTAAFIPARGGSTRIPRKNLCAVNGRSLLARAVDAGRVCDAVFVSTDDDEIAACAAACGAEVVLRPHALARSDSQIESAMMHWWRLLPPVERPDAIVLLQPTSPLRGAGDVRAAIALLEAGADSAVAVVLDRKGPFRGRVRPEEPFARYLPDRPDLSWRPRTQDVRPDAIECGAVYAVRRSVWERDRLRMGGHMAALVLPWWKAIDVDEPADLLAADAIARLVESGART